MHVLSTGPPAFKSDQVIAKESSTYCSMAVQMVGKLLGEGIRPSTEQSEASALPVTPGMIGVICFHRAQASALHPPHSTVFRAQSTSCWDTASQCVCRQEQ